MSALYTALANFFGGLLKLVAAVLPSFMWGKKSEQAKEAKDALEKSNEADSIRDRVRHDPKYRKRVQNRFRDG